MDQRQRHRGSRPPSGRPANHKRIVERYSWRTGITARLTAGGNHASRGWNGVRVSTSMTYPGPGSLPYPLTSFKSMTLARSWLWRGRKRQPSLISGYALWRNLRLVGISQPGSRTARTDREAKGGAVGECPQAAAPPVARPALTNTGQKHDHRLCGLVLLATTDDKSYLPVNTYWLSLWIVTFKSSAWSIFDASPTTTDRLSPGHVLLCRRQNLV